MKYNELQPLQNADMLANKINTLQAVNPMLAHEWHPTKNAPLTPHDVTSWSNKKVWWICSKGHEWNAVISSRSRGNGCPYCSSRKTHIDNCLQTINPELAKEWHPTKNAPLTPNDVTSRSAKKIWWICRKGHEWSALISNRSNGRGCPYCSGHMVTIDNCLQTKNPKLAKEWHPTKNAPLTPNDVTAKSNKKVWWVCRQGHEWNALISSRSNGKGCPYCSGRKTDIAKCIQTISPELAKQWHPTKNAPLTPNDVTVGSGKKVWWICRKGHEWNAVISSRSNGVGCPYCSSRKTHIDNCLQTKNPELAKEWHPTKNLPLTPNDVTPGSGKKVWWRCRIGHEWHAEIGLRSSGRNCPYCSNRKTHVDSCLQTINPELAKEWHPTKNAPLTPNDVTTCSGKKVWWLCPRGHEWNLSIILRSKKGMQCPYCAGRKLHSDNSLRTIRPELAKEWHPSKNAPLTPDDVTYKTKTKVWWMCRKGHEWNAQIYSRSMDSRGCPYCSGLKATEEDCLETISPWISKQWHPKKNLSWTPRDVTPHSGRYIWWECENGHEYLEPVIDRYRRGGCPVCILKRRYPQSS
jgi:hypothetical protein